MESFAAAVLALGIIDSLLLLVLVLRRVRLARDARRHADVADRVRPLALALIEGDDEPLDTLTDREREVLADVLGGYSRMVKGPAGARITAYFEQHGIVARELDALAHDRAPWRRAAAAHRLGDIGAQAAEEGLIAALEDDSREVRTAATRSLGRLCSAAAVTPIIAGVAAARIPTGIARWTVLQIGTQALPALRVAVDAEVPARRAGAVMLVGLLGDAADAGLLEASLRDTAAEVRAEAARGLGRIGGPRNFPAVVAALDDRVPIVRAAAATALGRLRANALEPILEVARDDHFDVARAAAYAAASIDLDATARAAEESLAPHLLEAVDMTRVA